MITKPTPVSPLDRAICHAGTVAALAAQIEVSSSLPSMWKKRGQVPAEHCPAIEKATRGIVRCEELRPDIEWSVLRQPHPAGRPCLDVAAPQEVRDAA